MAFKINVDKYSYSNAPDKNSQNYAAELAKKLSKEEAEIREQDDKALRELIESGLSQEAALRHEATVALNNTITAERAMREASFDTLAIQIEEEAGYRSAGDRSLSDSLSRLVDTVEAEKTTRAEADADLQKTIDALAAQAAAEIHDRQLAHSELSKLIADEIAKRSANDETLDSNKADINHTHTAEEVGALPDTTEIPSKVSQLENDKGYLTEHQDISGKADKTLITTNQAMDYGFNFSDTHNEEIRLSEVTSISFTFGDGEYPEDYISGLSFDSGEAPTAIDYTDSGILNWVGTDCATSEVLSIFQPSANTHYDIVFYFNGVQFIGLVNGFVPAAGNVVSV